MLPYFMRYNHINYARWGTVYLNEMHQLPQDVKREFEAGNFVVKRSPHSFNQVDPDQSQEWLNCVGKKGGGIIGITKTSSALGRWALSYNLRSHLALETREVFGLGSGDNFVHNETTKSRQKRDSVDEDALLLVLSRFGLFSSDMPQTLQNIANKDLVSKDIEEDLLAVERKGQEQLNTFVAERLLPAEERRVHFRDSLQKNKCLTFASLLEVRRSDSKTEKVKPVRADRSILQRLIAAYEAGRVVNLNIILTHELFVVPLSLAEANGRLRTGSKGLLTELLTADIQCPNHLEPTDLLDEPMLIIDGQALVMAIGKPQAAATFGDLAVTFVTSVLQSGAQFKRIDVVFDRYYEKSIKTATRQRRSKGSVAVRRPVDSRDVPLPQNWESFITNDSNKTDLARLLSQQLIAKAPHGKTIVAAGGFSDQEMVEASDANVETQALEGRHEEADTRTILHCVNSRASAIVVFSKDTDILVMLIAFFDMMPCQKIWMKAGTAKQRKYIPVHTIVEHLQMEPDTLKRLPGFHAVTGSDTTSYISGHSKKSCWKVFKKHHHLLRGLGDSPALCDQTIQDVEAFFCKIYSASDAASINEVRASMFVKGHTIERLPPTRDALLFHIKRSHYQTLVWPQAHLQHPVLPPPETMGWKVTDESLVPELASLPPVPDACEELLSCACTTGCRTARCKCRRSHYSCVASCKCRKDSDTCNNE